MTRRAAPGLLLRMAGLASLGLAMLGTAPHEAWSAQRCKPRRPLPAVIARTMGPCGFDPATASFAGDAVQQAACLLRPVARQAKLGPVLPALPAVLAERVGRIGDLPAREKLSAFLSRQDLEWNLGAYLWRPVSRARDNDPDAPIARYFVIHDTSGPNYGGRPWPPDIDNRFKINNLARFRCTDGFETAHVIVSRPGAMFVGHDFALPWRATKFERATRFGVDIKGLFLHVELIQPRRGSRGMIAPTPGFTAAQYDRLALLYVIASVRAERWLIPAFHAVIDREMRGGHDDPQNFELDQFARSLAALLHRLDDREEAADINVP